MKYYGKLDIFLKVCYGLNICDPSNSYIEALIPDGNIFQAACHKW
jgi:hypothetical protein